MNSNDVILTAVVLAAGTTLTAQYLNHKPVKFGRTITGAMGLGIGLSLIDTGAPDVAQGLAYLVILTSILVNGQPLFNRISEGLK